MNETVPLGTETAQPVKGDKTYMNARRVANIEDIEMSREFLVETFVEETLARQKEIQENKRDTLFSLNKFKESCNQISGHMQGIESGFKQQSIDFNKLQNTSSEFAASMLQLSRSSKNLAEIFAKTAKSIRKNLNRSQ